MIKVDWQKFAYDYTWFGWWAASYCEEKHKLEFHSDCKKCRQSMKWHYCHRKAWDYPGFKIIKSDDWINPEARF